ncbi:MAG TPA: hypothetical protein VMM59_09865 [Thermohalobaculum sp.]|nr:hypothetical protein [Thermohalobaculum sp.]
MIILLAASFAFTAVAAVAENTVSESRARLAAAWHQDAASHGARPVAASPEAAMHAPGRAPQPWGNNFRGGRKHPPAGR